MTRRPAGWLSLVALIALSPWSGVALAQAPQSNFAGVNVHIPSVDMLDAVQDLGLKWIRIDVNWQDIQPNKDTPPFWDVHDRAVDEARKRGLKVFATLAYFPRWATEAGADDQPNAAPGQRNFHNNVPLPGLYGQVAELVAAHFAGRIEYWGLWNETNLSHFFEGTREQWLDHVVVEGVQGFKAGCNSCKVVGPELAGLDNYHEWMDVFLAKLTAANLGVDVLSWHNYGNFEEIEPVLLCAGIHYFKHLMDEQRNCFGVPTGSAPMRPVIERHQLGHLPVWISETGYRAAKEDTARTAKQVTYYRRVLEEQAKRSWFTGSFFYELVDDNSADVPKWGMTYRSSDSPTYPASYQKKPVWDFIKKAATSPAFGGGGTLCDDGLDNDGDQLIDNAVECQVATDLGSVADAGASKDLGAGRDAAMTDSSAPLPPDSAVPIAEGGGPPPIGGDRGSPGSGGACSLGGSSSADTLPPLLAILWLLFSSRRRRRSSTTN